MEGLLEGGFGGLPPAMPKRKEKLQLVKVTRRMCVIVCEFKRLFIRHGTIIEMQWSYNLDLESLSLPATCFFFKIPFSGRAIDS